jgi:hypothetical protein
MTAIRRLHLALGALGLFAFLASGAYMKSVGHPAALPDREHLMYLSRHIYVLANALVHLALAAYVRPLATPRSRAAQWTGSALLGISGLSLTSAFVIEAVGQRGRTSASTYGLYLLLAGVLLHVVPALWSERRR